MIQVGAVNGVSDIESRLDIYAHMRIVAVFPL